MTVKTINFQLNGKTTAGEVEDPELLLDMLRERSGLKGAKEACSIGLEFFSIRMNGYQNLFRIIAPLSADSAKRAYNAR